MARLLTIEEVRDRFELQGCKLISKTYSGKKKPLDFICSCGNHATKNLDNFSSHPYCQKCGFKLRNSEKKHTYEFVEKTFSDAGCVLLSKEYIDSTTHLEYICNCGKKAKIRFPNFLNGNRCKQCGIRKVALSHRRSYEDVYEIFREYGCTLLSKEYVNCDLPLDYICSCGRKSKVRLKDILNGKKCRKCGIEKISGENNYQWKQEKTEEERILDRKYAEYREWINAVYERDKYTCQCCWTYGGKLRAHHLDGYHWCLERRTDVTNGVTLCEVCHDIQYDGSFHNIYGNKNNTEQQFNEWIRNKRKQGA